MKSKLLQRIVVSQTHQSDVRADRMAQPAHPHSTCCYRGERCGKYGHDHVHLADRVLFKCIRPDLDDRGRQQRNRELERLKPDGGWIHHPGDEHDRHREQFDPLSLHSVS
jgi:hypothetical protein